MLSGEGNAGEWWKTSIGLNIKKVTLAHLFCTFFVTRFLEEMSYVFSFPFFHCCSFSPCIGGR